MTLAPNPASMSDEPRKPTLYELGRKLGPMLLAALERIEAEDAEAAREAS